MERYYSIILCSDELYALNGGFNELCHGIYIQSFDEEIGVPRAQAKILFERIRSDIKKFRSAVEVGATELRTKMPLEATRVEFCVMRNILLSVQREIDDFEFEARLGVTKLEVAALAEKLSCFIASLPDQRN